MELWTEPFHRRDLKDEIGIGEIEDGGSEVEGRRVEKLAAEEWRRWKMQKALNWTPKI